MESTDQQTTSTQICPKCHIQVRTTDYFCFNCGNNLKPAPPSTDPYKQAVLYIKSALLPPLGIYWAIPYLKYPQTKQKIVGWVAVAITLIVLAYGIIWTNNFVKEFNKELNRQINSSLYL